MTIPHRPEYHGPRMAWVVGIALVVLVVIGAVSCQGDDSPDLPQAYGTADASVAYDAHPAYTGSDEEFLEILDDAGIPYSSDVAAITMARTACMMVQNYPSETAMREILDAAEDAGYTRAQASTITAALLVTC